MTPHASRPGASPGRVAAATPAPARSTPQPTGAKSAEGAPVPTAPAPAPAASSAVAASDVAAPTAAAVPAAPSAAVAPTAVPPAVDPVLTYRAAAEDVDSPVRPTTKPLRDRLATGVRRAVRLAVRAPRYVPVVLLRGYRLVISPLYGQTCRFYPSCSAYALEAFEVHGVFRGGYLAVRRLLRCHPWNPGGVDPVPTSGRRTRKDQAGPSAETRNNAPSTRRAA
jgi:putative membrane protein insertion efficiency factor